MEGRFLRPGLPELVVGRERAGTPTRAWRWAAPCSSGRATWLVVGVFDAGGSSFDSEVWGDADLVNRAYQRPPGISPDRERAPRLRGRARPRSRAGSAADPRMRVQVERETEYYAKASQMMTTLIRVLGAHGGGGDGHRRGLRRPQHHVLRGGRAVARGGHPARPRLPGSTHRGSPSPSRPCWWRGWAACSGALAVIPLNGLATSTLNFQTFSHLAFAFQVTPGLLALGVGLRPAHGPAGRRAARDPGRPPAGDGGAAGPLARTIHEVRSRLPREWSDLATLSRGGRVAPPSRGRCRA